MSLTTDILGVVDGEKADAVAKEDARTSTQVFMILFLFSYSFFIYVAPRDVDGTLFGGNKNPNKLIGITPVVIICISHRSPIQQTTNHHITAAAALQTKIAVPVYQTVRTGYRR